MKPRQPSTNQPGECISYLDTREGSPSRPPRWGRGFRRGQVVLLIEAPRHSYYWTTSITQMSPRSSRQVK